MVGEKRKSNTERGNLGEAMSEMIVSDEVFENLP